MATGLVWFPANSDKIKKVWQSFEKVTGNRMDVFLRKVIKPDLFWQDITKTIVDFKPKGQPLLSEIPKGTNLVCFHGKPRIHDADVKWVRDYVNYYPKPKVSVIIPYKVDRGWLKDAIASVPEWVQLIVSQGEGNWPSNFNKALSQATGDYIKFLHEDDMLTPNCIEDSVRVLKDVDFIHGNAIELSQKTGKWTNWKSPNKFVTLNDLLRTNPIHSATLMYKREVFEKIGGFNEYLNTAEEYEFNLRCLKAGFKIGFCDSTLAIYRRHDKQKVRVVPKVDKDREREMVRKIYA
jgi:hypothetical protein